MLHCGVSNDEKLAEALFVDPKTDANAEDNEGFSAMTYAVEFSGRHLDDNSRGFKETFQIERILLNHGGDINHIDIYGRTPLHYAFIKKHNLYCTGAKDPIELVSDICAVGKNVQVDVSDCFGRTPMHYAAMIGAQICANWLVMGGAKVNTSDYCNNQPFQHGMYQCIYLCFFFFLICFFFVFVL